MHYWLWWRAAVTTIESSCGSAMMPAKRKVEKGGANGIYYGLRGVCVCAGNYEIMHYIRKTGEKQTILASVIAPQNTQAHWCKNSTWYLRSDAASRVQHYLTTTCGQVFASAFLNLHPALEIRLAVRGHTRVKARLSRKHL